MFGFSKKAEPVKVKIGEGEDARHYKIKKWNALTTNLEGYKLVKTVLPAATTLIDSFFNKRKDTEDLGFEDNEHHVTEAAMLLQQSMDSEDYNELCVKLLKSVKFEGEDLDDEEKINDHFDQYPEDFMIVLYNCFKENLFDFFMKNGTLRKKIESFKTLLPSLKEELQSKLESSES